MALALVAAPAPADFAQRKAEANALAEKNDPRAEELLRQLVKESPDDSGLCFRYGYTLLIRAGTMKSGSPRTALIKEGRNCLLKAKAAGLDQPLIDSALAAYHEDGTVTENAPFSNDTKVNADIKAAEKDFALGKFSSALQHYQEALRGDPGNYMATLYVGDTYFATGRLDDAVTWYEKAIQLRPNAETPYRYRGDALRKLGRPREAIDSYVAAVVAEPYNRLPWHNLTQWAGQFGRDVRFRAAPLPKAELHPEKDKQEIFLSEKASVLSAVYATARVEWIDHNRPLAFSSGHYRQSLAEEMAGLEALLRFVAEAKRNSTRLDDETVQMESALLDLQRIADAGLLEAHVLLTRANADLAQDFAGYRDQNREKIAAYIKRFYLGEE